MRCGDIRIKATIRVLLAANTPDSQAREANMAMRGRQRMSSAGHAQNFDFAGLMAVACVSIAIIILSWTLEPSVRGARRWLLRRGENRPIGRVRQQSWQLMGCIPCW